MIKVQEEDFDISREISLLRESNTSIGAVVTFVGLVRDQTPSTGLTAMTLEHYPGMTEKELERIEAEARNRWPLEDVLIIHRIGKLDLQDQIVLVITAAVHREAAFEAAAFLMDWLKTKAPFWKQEHLSDSDHWVEANTKDDLAADRWKQKH